jgi:hypothetical protein
LAGNCELPSCPPRLRAGSAASLITESAHRSSRRYGSPLVIQTRVPGRSVAGGTPRRSRDASGMRGARGSSYPLAMPPTNQGRATQHTRNMEKRNRGCSGKQPRFQWRRRELNPGPRGVQSAFVHVRSRITQPTGFDIFGCRPSSRFSRPCHPEHWRDPALVMTPFRYQNYLSVGRLYCFLGSESDCIVVCNWYGPILERVGCLHTQTGLQSPRRNRSPPKGCGYSHHSYHAALVKAAGRRPRARPPAGLKLSPRRLRGRSWRGTANTKRGRP